MIVDAHCHVWPDALAARLVAARPAGLDAVGDGTVSGLLRAMDAAGIDYGCTLAIANEARHVARTNEFVGGLDRSRFIPCGTVHTGISVEENLRHLRDNGIVGVKFHPNFQGLSLGDPAVHEIFAALAEEGIPVLAHVGHGNDDAATERGATKHVSAIMDAVPDLVFVAFHYGGYHDLSGSEEQTLGDPRIYVETSWPPRLADLGADRVRALIERHGPRRVVFGSDWPMADPSDEIAFIRSLGLPTADEDAILGDTLAGLMGVTTPSTTTPQTSTDLQEDHPR
ncbi:amidohydrolase family protein [Nocardioides sediminis]|uniref:amidohydrolase family protein n=1 Tax=Nocardioides sediminis TaxID=433648 RepID=UPI000D304887|nr:amidohydrolase family protein [Nocardioides sediminis]